MFLTREWLVRIIYVLFGFAFIYHTIAWRRELQEEKKQRDKKNSTRRARLPSSPIFLQSNASSLYFHGLWTYLLFQLQSPRRQELLFEEASIRENPEVPVYREVHPLLPFSKDVAQCEHVQHLSIGVIQTVVKAFMEFRRSKPELFRSKEVMQGINVDPHISIQKTAARLIGEFEVKKRPKTRKINEFYQTRIEWIQRASKTLVELFKGGVTFDNTTTEADVAHWVQRNVKALFRVEVDPEKLDSVNSLVKDYFKSLTYDQERYDRFYKYRRAGFEVVAKPKIGDTVWYSGGAVFLQGIVTEKGIQTGVKREKRVHALFEVEPEYGREAIF